MKTLYLVFIMWLASLGLNADQTIPVAANTPGAQGSTWKTDVQAKNLGAEDNLITFDYNGNTLTKLIPANGVVFTEVLDEMGQENVFGPVKVIGDNVYVLSKIYNLIDGIQLAQSSRAYDENEFLKLGEEAFIIAAKHATDYRTNIGGTAGSQGATITIEQYNSLGNLKNTTVKTLGAMQNFQDSVVNLFGSVEANDYFKFKMDQGSGFLYGSVVQNQKGDVPGGDGNMIAFQKYKKIIEPPIGFKTINRPFFYEDVAEYVRSKKNEIADILANHIHYGFSPGASYPYDYPDHIYTKADWANFIELCTNNDVSDKKQIEQIFVMYDFDDRLNRENFIAWADYGEDTDVNNYEARAGYDMIVELEQEDLDAFLDIMEQGGFSLRNQETCEKLFPIVAKTPGAQGSYWRTDVQILNPTDEEIQLTFNYNGLTKTQSLGAKKVFSVENIVDFMGAQEGAGTLNVSANGEFLGQARTLNDVEGMEYSQSMRAFGVEERLSAGEKAYLISVKDSDLFRFNLGRQSINGASMTFRLLDAAGQVVSEKTETLEANGLRQDNIAQYFGIAIPNNASIEAIVNSGDVFVYGSQVENPKIVEGVEKGGDGNFIEAYKQASVLRQDDEVLYDLLFTHEQAAPILNAHAEEFAEIVYRNGYYTYPDGVSKKGTKEQWQSYIEAASDYNNNPNEPRTVELNYLALDFTRNIIYFIDAAGGLEFGWDSPITGLTDQEFLDFRNLFLSYYQNK
ncbi:MAG TPA: hypothetical protein PK014_02210 [Thermoanaerobaculia bacterium]|nr:hypothetical protein [Thermoanaerobaculia bacterium]HUM28953.1 hypothetical protein [Thermoanaerobaculia bacterium]HXK67115.1 hypothetical protein [Thermoanaerobaculia bacterium]